MNVKDMIKLQTEIAIKDSEGDLYGIIGNIWLMGALIVLFLGLVTPYYAHLAVKVVKILFLVFLGYVIVAVVYWLKAKKLKKKLMEA